jgi:TorA maturation chaperone TorD
MSLLLLKQVYAIAEGWTDRYDVAMRASIAFLEDHLARWAPVFCADLRSATNDEGFYATAAEVCELVIADEVQRSGARPRRVRSRVIQLDDTEPFQCGLVDIETSADDMPTN